MEAVIGVVTPMLSLFASVAYEYYASGHNSHGQLGIGQQGSDIDHYMTATGLFDSNITSIYAGKYHGMAITALGTAYGWGDNTCGQVNYGKDEQLYRPVQLEMQNVASLAGGDCHTIALLQNGSVFTWGSNLYGQLIRNTTFKDTKVPGIVDPSYYGGGKVKHIAAQGHVSYILTEGGIVYAYGKCQHGMCGVQKDDSSIVAPVLLKNIFVGENTLFVLGQNNMIYASGSNLNGELCIDTKLNQENQYILNLSEVQSLQNIHDIQPGPYHTLIIADTSIYGCGNNQFNQMSHEHMEILMKPTLLFSDSKLRDAAACQSGSIFLFSDHVEVIGQDINGELGNQKKLALKRTNLSFSMFNAKQVICRVDYSMIYDDDTDMSNNNHNIAIIVGVTVSVVVLLIVGVVVAFLLLRHRSNKYKKLNSLDKEAQNNAVDYNEW